MNQWTKLLNGAGLYCVLIGHQIPSSLLYWYCKRIGHNTCHDALFRKYLNQGIPSNSKSRNLTWRVQPNLDVCMGGYTLNLKCQHLIIFFIFDWRFHITVWTKFIVCEKLRSFFILPWKTRRHSKSREFWHYTIKREEKV